MKISNLERLQKANIDEMTDFIYEIAENGFTDNSKFLKYFSDFCTRECAERVQCNGEETYCCKQDIKEFIRYWLQRKGDNFICE